MERSVTDLSRYCLDCCREALEDKLTAEKWENADYLDFFAASQEEADAQIKRAETFGKWIEDYLNTFF